MSSIRSDYSVGLPPQQTTPKRPETPRSKTEIKPSDKYNPSRRPQDNYDSTLGNQVDTRA